MMIKSYVKWIPFMIQEERFTPLANLESWTTRPVGQHLTSNRGFLWDTPVTQRQPTRRRTTNATEIKKQSCGVNTCPGTTCHGSVYSVASCSQTGIYTLFPPVVSRVGCLGVTGEGFDCFSLTIFTKHIYRKRILISMLNSRTSSIPFPLGN